MPNVEYMADGDRVKTKNAAIASDDYVQGQYFVAPQNFSPDQGLATGATQTVVDGFPVYILRTGNDDFIDYSFNKPEHWRKGTVRVTIWTSDDGTAGSGDEYLMQVQVKGIPLGGPAVDILALTGSLVFSVAQASLTANEPIATTYTLTTPVAWGDYFSISLRIKRLESDGSDTMNTDDAYLFGAKVEYRPSQSQ